jgi:hypothetical protein
MIVRVDHTNGRQTEASLPTVGHDDAEYEDLARGLLASLPNVTRVRVWSDGLSFTDHPTVDVTASDAGTPPAVTDDVLDVATALLLIGHDDDDQPPPWLSRPYTGPGRPPARGTLPPV